MAKASGAAACLAWALLLLVASNFWSPRAAAKELDISPVRQATYVWCWVAVSEMLLKHYDVPNVNPAGHYQCGMVGLIAYGTVRHDCAYDCSRCTVPAGSGEVMRRAIETYSERARQLRRGDSPIVRARYQRRALSWSEVVREIDDENPVVAAISPSGRPGTYGQSSEHVALIVGYNREGRMLIVNDPYPFQGSWQNPYLRAGGEASASLQYEISYDAFRSRLQWGETITVRAVRSSSRRDPDDDDGEERQGLPRYCCTQAGKLGPYNNPGIAVGGACFGTHPRFGPVQGRACH